MMRLTYPPSTNSNQFGGQPVGKMPKSMSWSENLRGQSSASKTGQQQQQVEFRQTPGLFEDEEFLTNFYEGIDFLP